MNRDMEWPRVYLIPKHLDNKQLLIAQVIKKHHVEGHI
jgi:hypothetical protein